MITLEQLVERVRVEVRDRLGLFTLPPSLSRDVVEAFVRATLAGIDHHVNTVTGEIYSPTPKPVNVFPTQPRQNGVRYSGQPRRRRGGRR